MGNIISLIKNTKFFEITTFLRKMNTTHSPLVSVVFFGYFHCFGPKALAVIANSLTNSINKTCSALKQKGTVF